MSEFPPCIGCTTIIHRESTAIPMVLCALSGTLDIEGLDNALLLTSRRPNGAGATEGEIMLSNRMSPTNEYGPKTDLQPLNARSCLRRAASGRARGSFSYRHATEFVPW